MALAAQHGIRSIAFPAFSTGAYRFPPERAAQIAVREISAALAASTTIENVYVGAFDDQTVKIYRALLQ